ncbi:MAG: ATP-binding protein [Bacteroidetes bacterium]|nr:ATP-binding protein [Bacteroidota bacterium]MBS1540118.1 ATP-binding protein [Bacteroidota bacterium]
MKKTRPSASTSYDSEEVYELRKLVMEGEGQHLEFKHKVSQPEKIIREMIAFANSEGGTLLIGVDDNGTLAGVKYPDEELLLVRQALSQHMKQPLVYHDSLIELTPNKFVLRLDIPPSDNRPLYFTDEKNQHESFVRVEDKSIKASLQMNEIIRRKRLNKNIRFYFAEHELALMKYLEAHKTITLQEFRLLTGLSQYAASRKLILLVLANVLKITATEKGDYYSQAG